MEIQVTRTLIDSGGGHRFVWVASTVGKHGGSRIARGESVSEAIGNLVLALFPNQTTEPDGIVDVYIPL